MRSLVYGAIVLALVGGGGCRSKIGDSCRRSTDCSLQGDRTCDLSNRVNGRGECIIEGCGRDSCPKEAACVKSYGSDFLSVSCDPEREDIVALPRVVVALPPLDAAPAFEVHPELWGQLEDALECCDEEAWQEILALCEGWPDPQSLEQEVLPYCYEQLQTWPEDLQRTPLASWVRDHIAGTSGADFLTICHAPGGFLLEITLTGVGLEERVWLFVDGLEEAVTQAGDVVLSTWQG